jgi:hypothetical protein
MAPSRTTPRLRLTTQLVTSLLAALAMVVSCLVPTGIVTAAAATTTPPGPASLPAGIESLASYVPANSCSPTARPGTVKLGKLLTATYPGTTFGGARSCGALPNSEHHDGRAVDWMNSLRNAKQAAQAKAVIGWLLATDEDGNTYANARRLGVMYVIWNNKIWGAYSADQGWRPYSSCAKHPERSWDNTCHRNHMHLSLSWAGGMGRTSFWTGEVAAPDYGRCRPADLNWAWAYGGPNPTPCRRYGVVRPPKGASALLKSLTNYSGQHLVTGSKGAAVTVVQKAIHTKASGAYTSATAKAMKAWQADHKIVASGTVNKTTWRTLLRVNAP